LTITNNRRTRRIRQVRQTDTRVRQTGSDSPTWQCAQSGRLVRPLRTWQRTQSGRHATSRPPAHSPCIGHAEQSRAHHRVPHPRSPTHARACAAYDTPRRVLRPIYGTVLPLRVQPSGHSTYARFMPKRPWPAARLARLPQLNAGKRQASQAVEPVFVHIFGVAHP